MLVKRVLPLICLAGVVVCGLSFSTAAPGMEKSSEAMLAPSHEQVQSILNSNCLSCHNSEKRTGGFSVADLESVLEGGAKHGPAVIAGRPAESPLVTRHGTGEPAQESAPGRLSARRRTVPCPG